MLKLCDYSDMKISAKAIAYQRYRYLVIIETPSISCVFTYFFHIITFYYIFRLFFTLKADKYKL